MVEWYFFRLIPLDLVAFMWLVASRIRFPKVFSQYAVGVKLLNVAIVYFTASMRLYCSFYFCRFSGDYEKHRSAGIFFLW